MKRTYVLGGIILLLITGGAALAAMLLPRTVFAPTEPTGQPGKQAADLLPVTATAEPVSPNVPVTSPAAPAIETIAENLQIPWGIAWLPDGDMLVTERPGRLLLIGTDRHVLPISGVAHVGEGGLLGVAVHPRFSENRWVYLYLTTSTGAGLKNRVERYELTGNQLTNRIVIRDGIPGAQNHDGGYIAFGPDGLLYITTGDASREESAQDIDSLAGKILRLEGNGDIPDDNPGHRPIFSYGHRNPQGLAWDSSGQLWATEHGRSGVASGFDEINRIDAGQNYGWPAIQGDETQPGMQPPVVHSGAATTWAPAGAAIVGQRLFFGGLRGEALYELSLTGKPNLTTHFFTDFGRIRAVAVGPDNLLYMTTSNRDGRGRPKAGDDKIIRVNPAAL